jgi:hypothetical protein
MTVYAGVPVSRPGPPGLEAPPFRDRPGGPGRARALLVVFLLGLLFAALAGRRIDGDTPETRELGRWEVTARLLELPGSFPEVGEYRYTFVMPYEVLEVHRTSSLISLEPGDSIFVGHFQPHLTRQDAAAFRADLAAQVLGGTLSRFHPGEVHRMALDFPLGELSPVGIIDRCYPQQVKRFWAIWTNSTNLGRFGRMTQRSDVM